jgi:putative transcriptional regulator
MPFSKKQQTRLKKLGAAIKRIRQEKNLTLKELAHNLGKDPQSISRVEQADVNPSFLYLCELCEGLDISMEELMRETS